MKPDLQQALPMLSVEDCWLPTQQPLLPSFLLIEPQFDLDTWPLSQLQGDGCWLFQFNHGNSTALAGDLLSVCLCVWPWPMQGKYAGGEDCGKMCPSMIKVIALEKCLILPLDEILGGQCLKQKKPSWDHMEGGRGVKATLLCFWANQPVPIV